MTWPTLQLGQVATINPTRSVPESFTDDTPLSFVPMASVSEVSAAIETPIVRPFGEVRQGFTCFLENDVIMAKITPCMENGKIALAEGLVNGIGFGSTEFHVVRAKSAMLPRFAFYLLRQKAIRDAARQQMRGAVGQQRVPPNFLEKLPVSLPALSEQRRIVELLDKADALRKQRRVADEKAIRILPALFHKMFGHPSQWRSDLTEPLGKLVHPQGGGTPSRARNEYWTGEIPWVSPKDMKLDIISDSEEHISEAAVESSACSLIAPPAILVVVRGMILARRVPIALTRNPVAINQDMKALVIKDKRISPWYLLAALNACQDLLMSRVGTAAHGTRKLDSDRLLSLPILIPDDEPHQSFVEKYQALLALFSHREERLAKFDMLFSILLHRAFTGELTAHWREARREQLEVELREQLAALEQASSSSSARGRRGRSAP